MSRRILVFLAALLFALACAVLWSVRAAGPQSISVPAPMVASQDATAPGLVEMEPGSVPQRYVEDSGAPVPLLVRVVDLQGAAPETWWVQAVRDPDTTNPVASSPGSAASIEARSTPGAAALERGLYGSGDVPVELTASARQGSPRVVIQAKAFRENGFRYMESEPLVVDASMHGLITLVVATPTVLVVRVDGPRPSGDLRFEIHPVDGNSSATTRGPASTVADDGEASFRVTPAIAYRVRVSGPDPADVAETPVAGLRREEQRGVLVQFPGGLAVPVPTGYAVVALAGRVEFEGAERPGLWAAVDGGLPISIGVRANGEFELMHVRGESVELHAAGEEFEARFDPEVSTHPFGTQGVILRSVPSAPGVEVSIRIVAAESGEPLTDANVTIQRLDGARMRQKHLGTLNAATTTVTLPALEDLEYLVCSRDRRDAIGRILFPGGPGSSARVECTIRLERGFRREFRVQHCSLHTPIEGAEVLLDGVCLGRSDAEGRVLVELGAWPGRLTVRADTFDEGYWPPQWQASIPARGITLCPQD